LTTLVLDAYLFTLMNKYSSLEATRRREEILRIVRTTSVHSHEELQALLHKGGFDVTQPTVSRDIRDLGLAKTPGGYALVGDTQGSVVSFVTPATREHKLRQALGEFALSVEQAGTMIVIKTPVAAAQPLALALDAADFPQLLGTIAGDDTIFLVVRSVAAAGKLSRHLGESISQPRRDQRRARA